MKANLAILMIAAFAAQQTNANAPDSQARALCQNEWNGKIANMTLTDKSRSFKGVSRSVCVSNFGKSESLAMDAEYDYATPSVAGMLLKTMPPLDEKYFEEHNEGSQVSAVLCNVLGGSLMQELVPELGYAQDGVAGDFLPFCHFGDGSKADMRALYEVQRTPFIENRENEFVKLRESLSEEVYMVGFHLSEPFFIIPEPVTDCTEDADCASEEDTCSKSSQPMVCGEQKICVSAVQKCSNDADCDSARTSLKSFDANENGKGYCVPTACDTNTNTCVARSEYRNL